MPKVTFTQPSGDQFTVSAEVGRRVMKVAVENLVPGIVGECGGDLSCATCHVFVDDPWLAKLPPMTAEEELMLDATSEEPTAASRLCCQITLTEDLDGLSLHVPETQQ
jgi:2Fe-2S ferredoxin